MRSPFPSMVGAGLLVLAGALAAPPAQAQSAPATLFQALGGQAGLASLTTDLVQRLRADARIGALFKDTNLRELQRQLADQFCAVADGPCVYEGANMKDAHSDMKIGKAEFNALVELLQAAMDAQGLPFAVQNRLLALLAPMHRDVITSR